MSISQIAIPETNTEQSTEEIQLGLRRIARNNWSLWGTALVVILALTAAVASLSLWLTSDSTDPFYQFHISQSVRGLLGLVLLFSVYTFYQQLQLKRTRGQLAEQITAVGRQQKRAEEFLKLASLDSLTGLHNRRFAEERLASDITRSQRNQVSLTILMLDLDDLKKINDLHGHAAGDAALKIFAERLMAATRGSDLAARIGGDEFVVLLPECKVGGVRRVLDRLTPLEIEVDEKKVAFSYSAGWTDYQMGETSPQFLGRADQAVYAQKRNRTTQPQRTTPPG
jgi:diguanylate cyclase (GGDEF)-like protein